MGVLGEEGLEGQREADVDEGKEENKTDDVLEHGASEGHCEGAEVAGVEEVEGGSDPAQNQNARHQLEVVTSQSVVGDVEDAKDKTDEEG